MGVEKLLGQTQQFGEPVHDDHLEFGAGRRRDPGEPDAADTGAQHLADDRWIGIGGGVVSVEVRRVPVCDLFT